MLNNEIIYQSSQELLPCPCCGGKAKLNKEYWAGGYEYAVKCTKCQIGTMYSNNYNKTIKVWNTRYKESEEK